MRAVRRKSIRLGSAAATIKSGTRHSYRDARVRRPSEGFSRSYITFVFSRDDTLDAYPAH
jgi:hypothetical protein